MPGVRFVEPNDLAALEAAVSELTSAIILEPIMGEGGIIPLTTEFLSGARKLADRTGAILIFDVWNPHLTGSEQEMLRSLFQEMNDYGLDAGGSVDN